MADNSVSLTIRLKNYYGLQPGQGLADFSAEVRKLSDADKVYFIDLFNKAGLPTHLPSQIPSAAA